MSISKNPNVARVERSFLFTGLLIFFLVFIEKIFNTPVLDPRLIFLFPMVIYLLLKYVIKS